MQSLTCLGFWQFRVALRPDLERYQAWRSYLTESVEKVVSQKSIPAQISQLIVYHYWYKEQICAGN